MNPTCASRPPLADPRRGFVSVLTVAFLVLVVLAVQAVCGVHAHEADHSSTSPHVAVEQHAASGAAASDPAAQIAPGHPSEDPNDCVEDRTVTARYDRTLSPSIDLAGAQSLALRWLVPDIRNDAPRAPSGLAVAAAPSLHALGISRT
jgi:hypothetical protein